MRNTASDGTLIDRLLPQEELAEQIGSNRRSVVRTLDRLYSSGALKRRGRRFLITDTHKLLAAVKGEVADLLHCSAVADPPVAIAV